MDNTQTIEAMKNAMQQKGKEYKEAELIKDPLWGEASALVYKMKEGKDFEGKPEDLAKYGIDHMSKFNYNIAFGMIPDVLDVEKADHDTQVAFAYMMDAYEKKDISVAGFGRATKELFLDPTNYIGISTLGSGFMLKKSGSDLAKESIKNRITAKIRSYLENQVAVGATEGAMYTAGDVTARQKIQKEAGLRDEYSLKDIATTGAAGAVIGGGLVKGLQSLEKGAKK